MPGRNTELVIPGVGVPLPLGDIGRELGGVDVREVDAKREETEGDERR